MAEVDQQQDVTDAVREAVESGDDVHRRVKEITLKALTKGELDMKNIKNVAEAVARGIDEGISGQDEHAKGNFTRAVTALDDALAIATEASTLAIQEAAVKVSEQHDFMDAIKDIQGMERLFIDTLEKVAKGSTQVTADIVNDFIDHAHKSGTAVGKQTVSALKALGNLSAISPGAIISGTVTSASTLANIASGILSGIAESLQPSDSKK
ncbi:DUF6781 family protein [Candidatus Methylobacter oryzae]|uniref:Uncharacterized protein n=1 Tax=Candidatus Methylobacter oryzae TaxID=2497749 RepID=A0ABY3CMA0_9GAMM|nr:DUF6781 family protein [Candidatus Methylobacter oryzae]TRX03052.1 hypothetical protein EKO24_001855 [Candidatus Methylobacter oryzae]